MSRLTGVTFAFCLTCWAAAASLTPGFAEGTPPPPLPAANLPGPTIPDGLGVNIHFTGAPAKDLAMIQAAGFKFVRMDMTWSSVERRKGVYDFSAYDALTKGLQEHGIRPLYILDYGNALYGSAMSITTNTEREAFARFAAAAVARYRGKSVVWEIWNEPNESFWKPKPNAGEYMALVRAVVPAMRAADSAATIIAPATFRFDWGFLEQCFKDGLLSLVNAVSIHPYYNVPPESLPGDVARLRGLMRRYSRYGSSIPIVSSEWGYSSIRGKQSEVVQGEYLVRDFLVDLSLGIPISIWYDWHNDGSNPAYAEENFGTVTYDYHPKPAYTEMERLAASLGGLRYEGRLPSAQDDWLLLFTNGSRSVLAVWTTGAPHSAIFYHDITGRLTEDPRYIPISAQLGAGLPLHR